MASRDLWPDLCSGVSYEGRPLPPSLRYAERSEALSPRLSPCHPCHRGWSSPDGYAKLPLSPRFGAILGSWICSKSAFHLLSHGVTPPVSRLPRPSAGS